MAKVITFSTHYPAYHPKKGVETFFVNKLWKSLDILPDMWLLSKLNSGRSYWDCSHYIDVYNQRKGFEIPKHHTIRMGRRWKAGDKFSPRIWSANPYNSPQIIIAPDIEIKKVWNISIDGESIWIERGKGKTHVDWATMHVLALNDGLTREDLKAWFKMPCKRQEAQVICWNDKLIY